MNFYYNLTIRNNERCRCLPIDAYNNFHWTNTKFLKFALLFPHNTLIRDDADDQLFTILANVDKY